MTSLTTLISAVRKCDHCAKHLPLGPRPVVQLHERAKILIVGQAPGKKVHETGVPFDDLSGDRLRHWMGITPEVFYDPKQIAILPMGFCYPGRGKSGDLPPRPECVPKWRSELMVHLQQISLTLVVGQYALAYHLKDTAPTLTETVKMWGEIFTR